MHHVAYREGFCAFKDGVPYDKNPYPKGTSGYKQWLFGWYATVVAPDLEGALELYNVK